MLGALSLTANSDTGSHKAHKLALIPCGMKAGILRRGKVESCQAFVLEQLQLLLLNQ